VLSCSTHARTHAVDRALYCIDSLNDDINTILTFEVVAAVRYALSRGLDTTRAEQLTRNLYAEEENREKCRGGGGRGEKMRSEEKRCEKKRRKEEGGRKGRENCRESGGERCKV
jgi:hypothetical protein